MWGDRERTGTMAGEEVWQRVWGRGQGLWLVMRCGRGWWEWPGTIADDEVWQRVVGVARDNS